MNVNKTEYLRTLVCYRNILIVLTAFLIIALVIAVHQDGVTAQLVGTYDKLDLVAQEARNRAVTIIDGPKLTPTQTPPPPPTNNTLKPEQRPPSKPPIKPDKVKYIELPRLYYSQLPNLPPLRQHYNKPLKIQTPNSVFKYHKVIPLQPLRTTMPLIFAESKNKPSISKSPNFKLPVETINGIRSDFVRPPRLVNATSTTTTTAATTTAKKLRTKRIWPKHILDKINAVTSNTTANKTVDDLHSSASHVRYVYKNRTETTTVTSSTTRGPYRRVTRVPKKRATTAAPESYTRFEPNEWVPIVPHYPINKVRVFKKTPISRRSDSFFYYPDESTERRPNNKRTVYLQSFGLLPMESAPKPSINRRKHIKIIVGKKKVPKGSRYKRRPVSHVIRQHPFDQVEPKVVTRVKHHHHHHHHRYIKTVDKPVHIEVPKPVPVPVPMPIPIRVEQRVPYPVEVKVPHPVPVKVVEKEYVPKPYPVFQQVPVVKHVEVKVPQPYPVERRVPYPVEVKVPVDKPYPVHIEKRVPYPVPVKVYVPQPYPVETKVPYGVKEQVEVIKHVPVRVPYPQPYPVHVKVPVPFEKKIPYPVEVEKKVAVPVPYRVNVPEKIEVEKKVPVYVPKPYPVEKKVPVPVRVPYPVRVPIKIPVGIPILIHPSPQNYQSDSANVIDDESNQNQHHVHYSYAVQGDTALSVNNQPNQHSVTEIPHHSVTVHGNGATSTQHSVTVHGRPGFGFQSRSDLIDETTTANPGTSTFDPSLTEDPQVTTAFIHSAMAEVLQLLSDDPATYPR